MDLNNYVLVPEVVEIHTNITSIPGFKFGFAFHEINKFKASHSKVKLYYLVVRDVDHSKYFSHEDLEHKYREVLINEQANIILFEKKIFNLLKLQFLLDVRDINSPKVLVNKFYHKYWRNTFGHIYSPGIILHNLLAMVLTMKNFVPICFSAVQIYDKSFLLIGISGSGKTSLICKVIKSGGRVISEDNLVIDKDGNIYSCIHMLANPKSLKTIIHYCNIDISAKKRLTLFDLFDENNISVKGKIDGVVFLERGRPCLTELSIDESLNRISILNKGNYFYETIPVTQALMFFNKRFSEVRKKEEQILKKALRKSKIALIRWKTIDHLYDLFMRFVKVV